LRNGAGPQAVTKRYSPFGGRNQALRLEYPFLRTESSLGTPFNPITTNHSGKRHATIWTIWTFLPRFQIDADGNRRREGRWADGEAGNGLLAAREKIGFCRGLREFPRNEFV